jgi:hypothetical protein
MLSIAFKEWAAICRALATGRQSIILRKGGIAEAGGTFRPEHSEFLLYPTFFHEHRSGVKQELHALFDEAEKSKPEPGTIRFEHFVRVTGVQLLADLGEALALDSLHCWTEDVVRQRFHYRMPGFFVLDVEVFELEEAALRAERPEYAGCRTWVTLDRPVASDRARPIASRGPH